MIFLYVNGNRVHDEGEHDAALRVTREGDAGAPLTFATQAEGEAYADALHARDVAAAQDRRRRAPLRSSYVVASEPPLSPSK